MTGEVCYVRELTRVSAVDVNIRCHVVLTGNAQTVC